VLPVASASAAPAANTVQLKGAVSLTSSSAGLLGALATAESVRDIQAALSTMINAALSPATAEVQVTGIADAATGVSLYQVAARAARRLTGATAVVSYTVNLPPSASAATQTLFANNFGPASTLSGFSTAVAAAITGIAGASGNTALSTLTISAAPVAPASAASTASASPAPSIVGPVVGGVVGFLVLCAILIRCFCWSKAAAPSGDLKLRQPPSSPKVAPAPESAV